MNKKKILIWSIISILIIAVIVLLIIYGPRVLNYFKDPALREKFKNFIESLGFFGVFVYILVIVIQIIVAFIPGEPFELLAGIMYGTFGGLLISLIGAFIGSTIVFLLVKKFGKRITNKFFSEEKMQKYKFLNSERNRNRLLFIIFLIPGTPKDLLTYFAPLTPIKYSSYIIITTIARIPSIITSTIAGESILEGDYHIAIIVYGITFLLTIFGILIDNYIQKKKTNSQN